MTIYYVDATDGDDAKDGQTEANAWKTISKVNGESYSAGDSILFQRGETWATNTDAALTPPDSGSIGSPIVFGAYGSGDKPILDGNDAAARNVIIAITDYVTIQDFSIVGWTARGIHATNSDGTVVQRCMVTGGSGAAPAHGIQIQGTTDPLEVDVEIKDNTIGTIHTAENDTVSYNGIIVHGVVDAVISGNTFNTTNVVGLRLLRGTVTNSTGIVVENNEFYGCYGAGIIVAYCDSTILRYNVIRDFDHGQGISVGYDSDDAEVYYNLIYNIAEKSTNLWNGIDINNDAQTGAIYNNTIYNVSGNSIVIGDDTADCDGWILKNNLLDASQNNNDAITPLSLKIGGATISWTSDNNLFWRGSAGLDVAETGDTTQRTLAEWKAATSEDAASVEGDPLFVNAGGSNVADYGLTASSPCIDVGTDVSLTRDYFGNPVPMGDAEDIGAHEFSLMMGMLKFGFGFGVGV